MSREAAQRAIQKVRELLADIAGEYKPVAGRVASAQELLDEADAALSRRREAIRPRRPTVQFSIEVVAEEELLTERRFGTASAALRCPRSVYTHASDALSAASRGLRFEELVAKVREQDAGAKDYKLRVAVRFWLSLWLIERKLGRYRVKSRVDLPRETRRVCEALNSHNPTRRSRAG